MLGIQPQEECGEIQKLVNLLREIRNLFTLDREHEAQPIWKKACRLGAESAKHQPWNQRYLPSLEAIETLITRVEGILPKVSWGTVYARLIIWRRRLVAPFPWTRTSTANCT